MTKDSFKTAKILEYHKDILPFRLGWVLSVVLGSTIGPFLAGILLLLLPASQINLYSFFIAEGVAHGLVIGLLQYWLLRQWLLSSHRWIGGCLIGYVLASLMSRAQSNTGLGMNSIQQLIFGVLLAVAQGLSIHPQLSKSWLWITANALGWPLGAMLGTVISETTSSKFLFFPVLGVVVGLITAEAMIRILKTQEWVYSNPS